MKHFQTLIEKLSIPSDLVEAISQETLPDDFDQKVESYNKQRIDYFKATTEFKNIEKEIGDRTYAGAVLKHVKRFNTALGLGLTNPEMENIKSIDEFSEKVKAYLAEHEKKLINTNDQSLKTDLEKYKEAASKYINENQELLSKIELVKKEAEERATNTIEQFKAETYFHKMVSTDSKLPGIAGQEAILDAIKLKIFQNYIVKGDGTILAKDGTAATHPEKPTIVQKIEDIYEYEKNKFNLVIHSNAGAGSGQQSPQTGYDPSLAAMLEELRKARMQ